MRSFKTGSPDEFYSYLKRHDLAQTLVIDRLERMGLRYKETGYDPRGTGERGEYGSPDRRPDLLVEALPVEIKTKSNADWLGNVPKRKWDDYPRGTWFAWFHVTGDLRVQGAASFQKGNGSEVVGEEDTARGDTMLKVRPLGPIEDMYDDLRTIAGELQ